MEDTEQGDIDYWITPKVDCIGKNMVVFIKSRMESFGIRQIIRNTWVSVATRYGSAGTSQYVCYCRVCSIAIGIF